MKGHVKRAIEVVEACGFELDEQASHHGTRVYRHPNAPEEPPIKIFSGASEAACITHIRRAQRIAETGWSGPKMPTTIGERYKQQRAEKQLKRDREFAEYKARAEKAEAHYQNWRAEEAADNHRREIERLMMPGR